MPGLLGSVCIFVPAYMAVGVMLTIRECLHGERPVAERRSRTPLLRRRKKQQKTRKHWWQFWRKSARDTLDLERGLISQTETVGYSTFFSGQQPQAALGPQPSTDSRELIDSITFFPGFDGQPTQAVFDNVFADQNSLPDGFSGFDGLPLAAVSDDIWLDETVAGASVSSVIVRRASIFENPRTPPPVPTRTPPAPKGEFEPEFTIIRKLKYENMGKLFLVRYNQTGEPCIIKQIKMEKSRAGKLIMPDDADVLINGFRADHDNILHLANYWENPKTAVANLVYEYCSAGDVANLIEANLDRDEPVHPIFILHFVIGMIKALSFMHSGVQATFKKGVLRKRYVHDQAAYIHQDIKPHNIFLRWGKDSRYGMPDIILGDFGFARPEGSPGAQGTNYYWPPEVEKQYKLQLEDDRYKKIPVWSKEGDMYSFGASLYQLITLKRYRPGNDIVDAVMASRLVEFPEAAAVIADMLEACLEPNKADRPTSDSFLTWCAYFQQMIQEWYEDGGKIPEGTFPDPFYGDDMIQSFHASMMPVPRPRQAKPPTWRDEPPSSLALTRVQANGSTPYYSVLNPYYENSRSLTKYPDAAAGAENSVSPYQLSEASTEISPPQQSSETSTGSSSSLRRSPSQDMPLRQLERAMTTFVEYEDAQAGAEPQSAFDWD